ncbi:MAG: hypothetical protein EBY09_08345 [Verrucomicrobia bacterium]|nr:hypothetical protein [Verrucomicrobiota bacterium]NDD37535.1 hypothetical protein [Verrucomicrobiota bacterium]NDE98325.1 hypothetical protein [Verrucomicrobiota bacterium]
MAERQPTYGARAPSAATRPVRRRLIAQFALLVGAALVAALLVECAVRVMLGDRIVLFPRYHTGADYGEFKLRRLRPGEHFRHHSRDGDWEFRINRAGLRNDREFARPKPAGVYRVLCLGDSHTQGYEVRQEHTFAMVLERFLNAQGLRAEVINAGISGFGTAEEVAYLESEGVKWEPDAVVLGFFANDYEDNLKAGLFELEGGGSLKAVKHEHLPGVSVQDKLYAVPGTRWLGEHSYAYAHVFNLVWEHYKARLAADARATAPTESAVATRSADDHETRLAAAVLARLGDFCRARGIQSLVLDLPQTDERSVARASLNAGARAAVERHCDDLLAYETLLQPYAGAAELHVAHGQRHISEFTHAVFGVAAGQRLMARRAATKAALPKADQPR